MTSYEPFLDLVRSLRDRGIRFILIGVWAANYYARRAGHVFATEDRDFFLPLDSQNLLNSWKASRESGYELWAGDEPLGEPLDSWLAEKIVAKRANTSALHASGIQVDFTLEMKGFDFETVWDERRTFRVENVEIPVARLSHIVESKAKVGRPKDQLFLATWEEALRDLLKDE